MEICLFELLLIAEDVRIFANANLVLINAVFVILDAIFIILDAVYVIADGVHVIARSGKVPHFTRDKCGKPSGK